MKKVIFISALAIAAAVSCTKSDIVDTKFDEQIGFENYLGRTAQTKAASVEELAEVGLYGFYTGADVWNEATSSNLWGNARLYKNGTSWTYTPAKYWTNEDDNYTFLAYAPYVAGASATSAEGQTTEELTKEYGDGSLTVNAGLKVADPTVTYTVPSALGNQQDVLYANVLNTSKRTATDGVKLQFHHALSRITVTAKDAVSNDDYTYNVYGVKINGDFVKTNTLNLATGNWETSEVYENRDYVFQQYTYTEKEKEGGVKIQVPANTPVSLDGDAHNFADNDNYLMVIPTNVTETPSVTDATLTVTYTTIFDGKESTPMTKELTISQTYLKGHAYAIALKFAPNTDNVISFTVEVVGWDKTNETTPIVPEKPTTWPEDSQKDPSNPEAY